MRTVLTFFCVFCFSLFLSSCDFNRSNIEGLMHPPKLTEEQSELYSALEATLGESNIRLKYPKAGDYRSAFVFWDLDGDGIEEALAFYESTVAGESGTRICILDKSSGSWVSVYNMPGLGSDVEQVQFAHLTDPSLGNVVITWSENDAEQETVGVYSFRSEQLVTEFYAPCIAVAIHDVDDDQLDDLLVVGSPENYRRVLVRYIRMQEGKLAEQAVAALHSNLVSVEQLAYAPISENQDALFIDGLLEDGTMTTDAFVFEDDTPVSVFRSQGENTVSRPDRQVFVTCRDINGDGIWEIPYSHPLPGYEAQTEDALSLVEFRQYRGDSFSTISAGYVSLQDGYWLVFPKNWVGNVSAVRQTGTNEVIFFEYLGSLNDQSKELLRIRVYSKNDYQDKFAESYVNLENKGLSMYYALLPDTSDSALAIDLEQLRGQFELL